MYFYATINLMKDVKKTQTKKPNPTKGKKMPQRAPKNPNGGKPRKYKTKEELQVMVDKYFADCYRHKHDRVKVKQTSFDPDTGKKIEKEVFEWEPVYYPDGTPVMEYVKPVTITGLCILLGMSREQLIEYEGHDEYSDTIKRARQQVQDYVEYALMSGSAPPAAAIFNMKNNYGWKDKTESEVTNTHLHLHGVAKASYQEADKAERLASPQYRELPEAYKLPIKDIKDNQSIKDIEKDA